MSSDEEGIDDNVLESSDEDDGLMDFSSSKKSVTTDEEDEAEEDVPNRSNCRRTKSVKASELELRKVEKESYKLEEAERKLTAERLRKRKAATPKFSAVALLKENPKHAELKEFQAAVSEGPSMRERIKLSREQQEKDETETILTDEQTRVLAMVSASTANIKDKNPGENVFARANTSQLLIPTLEMPQANLPATFFKILSSAANDPSSPALLELVCGGWIESFFANKRCPSEIADWLFRILVWQSDELVVEQCFRCLCTVCLDQPMGDSHGWCPSLQCVIEALLAYGATCNSLHLASILSDHHPSVLTSVIAFETKCQTAREEDDDDHNNNNNNNNNKHANDDGGAKSNTLRSRAPLCCLHKMLLIIKAVIEKQPLSWARPDTDTDASDAPSKTFSVQDAKALVLLLLRLGVHSDGLGAIAIDISWCVGALLETIPPQHLNSSVDFIARNICEISSHHHDQVFLLRLLPLSHRGRQLTELSAKIISKKHFEAEAPDDMDMPVMEFFLKMMGGMQPKITASGGGTYGDYYLLYSYYSIVDLCLYNEPYSASKPIPLAELCGFSSNNTGMFLLHHSKFKRGTNNLDGEKIKYLLQLLHAKARTICEASLPPSEAKQRKIHNSLGWSKN